MKLKKSVPIFMFLLTMLFITTALASDESTYVLTDAEKERWGISDQGENALETTTGFNDALKWASENGYTVFKVEAGEYLIAKGEQGEEHDSRINMVSDMTFLMDEEAVLRKEANGHEGYSVIHVGANVKNATLQGGHLIGDREEHNYSSNEHGGTHEWGNGIQILGAEHVTVDNVKIEKFTGDGIYIGGTTIAGSYITEGHLEKGSLNELGQPIDEEGKIRTVGRVQTNFDNLTSQDPHHRNVHMWLPSGLTSKQFEIYFFDTEDNFIRKDQGRVYSNGVSIPDGAAYFRAVFDADQVEGVQVNRMAIANSNNIVIKNSDIGHNRRQGITAGGENVQILNNKIHNTNGTAPQAGIDIEPGHYPAKNHVIKGNEFYNNKIQIVLAYGEDATIEENTFEQTETGMVGVHVHKGYRGDVSINNNSFVGSGLTMYNEGATAEGNNFIGGQVKLLGDKQSFIEASLNDTELHVGNGNEQKASNIQLMSEGVKSVLYIWHKPVHLEDITINSKSKDGGIIQGYGHNDSLYNNLKIIDHENKSTILPAGTYNNAYIESQVRINREGIFVLNDSYVKTNSNILRVDGTYGNPHVTINNSTLEMTGNVGYGACIYVLGAEEFNLLNSKVLATNNTEAVPVMKFGGYGYPGPTKVFGVTLKDNDIHVKNDERITTLDTANAGVDAPSYIIEGNMFFNGKLNLKENDHFVGNQEVTQ